MSKVFEDVGHTTGNAKWQPRVRELKPINITAPQGQLRTNGASPEMKKEIKYEGKLTSESNALKHPICKNQHKTALQLKRSVGH